MFAPCFLVAGLAVLQYGLASPQEQPSAKIDPLLRETFASQHGLRATGELYPVYAVLAEPLTPAELAPELDGLPRKERCKRVVDRLRSYANEKQRDLSTVLNQLELTGDVEQVHQLWIGNATVFHGTRTAIETVARLSEVVRIGWDPPLDPAQSNDQQYSPMPRSQAVLQAPEVYYQQDFESGLLGSELETATTNCGVAEVTGQYGPVGNHHVVLYSDTPSCDSTASLTLTVDLSSAHNPKLRYSFKDMDDEFDPGFDLVAASDDGGASWVPIADLNPLVENVHAPHTDELDGLGLSYVSDFKLRWSWRDRSGPPEDGFGIDDIVIQNRFDSTPPPAPQPNLVQHQATDLWDLGYTGQGVTILNIDRGVDYRHPDLAGRIFVNPLDPIDELDNDGNGYVDDHMGWDFIENDNDPLPSFFYGEHGTNTAGIMVGDGASGLARTGMAPGAKLAVCRINGQSQQWLAIQWGLSVGIDCNSSSNSYQWSAAPKPDYHMHRALHDMVLAAGVIHANSIGNLAGSSAHPIPFQITIPAGCPAPWRHPDQVDLGGVSAVMAVGGIELDDTLFLPSSIGPFAWEDITLYDRNYAHSQNPSYWDYLRGGFGGGDDPRPGFQGLIKPDVVAYSNVVTTNGPSSYLASFWGTSASTPHVGGAFALILSVCPDATPAEICQALQETAIDMGPPGKDSTYGAGRIQVLDAAMQLMCVLRSTASAPPVGEPFELTVLGRPLNPYLVAVASDVKEPGASRGWGLQAPLAIIGSGVLDETGKAVLPPITIPDDPRLIGRTFHYQVVADDRGGKTGKLLRSPVASLTVSPRRR